MDAPTITLEVAHESTDQPKDTLIGIKLQDPISALQNSSDISVSKLHQQCRNSQIQEGQKPNPSQDFEQKPNQTQIKFENEDSDSSSESGGDQIKDVKKSGREQKFKRSTNNSHKKFISVARRWLFKNHRGQLKVAFENKFHAFRSTRTYFFIILAFIKTIMSEQKQRQFQAHFTKQVSVKILEYEKQIENTTNQNLKHFRSDEVTDLKFSIRASDVYFEGDLDKSIECVYKKDKTTIVKKHHYEQALKTVRGIESEFQQPNFLENTIAIYGGKKIRNKSGGNQDNWIKNGQYSNSKDSRSRFFFPEMFGRKVGLIYGSSDILKRQNEVEMTAQPSQVESHIELGLQIKSEIDESQLEKNEKKLIKVYIVPQIIKMELQTEANQCNQTVNNCIQTLNNFNQTVNPDDIKPPQDV